MASRLECSTPDRGVRVRVLAREIVLCSWERPFTLTVPLYTQVYRNAVGNPEINLHPIQGGGGGVQILLVASCYGDRREVPA